MESGSKSSPEPDGLQRRSNLRSNREAEFLLRFVSRKKPNNGVQLVVH